MTLHLIYNSFYILFFILAIVFATTPNLIGQKKLFFYSWFLIIFSFIFFFRIYYIPFLFENYFDIIKTSDLYGYYALSKGITYGDTINTINFGFSNSHEIYYTREPLVWLLLKYLYFIFNDTRYVFLTIDVIAYLILFFSLKQFEGNNKNNLVNINYVYFLMLLHTPLIFGMSSIYRQFISMIFLLAAFSYFYNNKNFKSYILIIFSIAAHNASAIFLYFYFIKENKLFNILMSITFCMTLIIVFALLYDVRTGINIGSKIGYFYTAIYFIFSSIIIALDRIGKLKKDIILSSHFFMSTTILFIGSVILYSNWVDRFFLYMITVSCPLIALYIERNIVNNLIIRYLLIFTIICYTVIYTKPFFTTYYS